MPVCLETGDLTGFFVFWTHLIDAGSLNIWIHLYLIGYDNLLSLESISLMENSDFSAIS